MSGIAPIYLVLATVAVVAAAAAPPSADSWLQRRYDKYFGKLYSGNGLADDLTVHIPCGSTTEELSYFDSDSGREAAGEAIVLLHGFTGDKRSWLPMVEWLTPGHRVVAVDLAGHGLSEEAADAEEVGYEAYSFERQAERVHLLAERLDPPLEHYHVLGHSMGGAVAIKLASKYPAEVLSLGLIASAGTKDQHTDKVMRYINGDPSINPLIIGDQWNARRRLRLVANRPWRLKLASWFLNKPMTDEALPKQCLFYSIFEVLKARETNDPLTCTDLDPNRPTFYLYGGKDRVLKPAWAKCFSPRPRRHWIPRKIPRAGHSPIVERPEKIAKIYLGFLDGLRKEP